MRWHVRKLRPHEDPSDARRWISYPASLGYPTLNLRRHHTHRQALDRAIRKAYGR